MTPTTEIPHYDGKMPELVFALTTSNLPSQRQFYSALQRQLSQDSLTHQKDGRTDCFKLLGQISNHLGSVAHVFTSTDLNSALVVVPKYDCIEDLATQVSRLDYERLSDFFNLVQQSYAQIPDFARTDIQRRLNDVIAKSTELGKLGKVKGLPTYF